MKSKLLLIALLLSLVSWGQATLPVATAGLARASLPTGFTQSGLGTDYASSNITGCSTALRFDNASDFLQLNFTGVPGTMTYQLRGNTGAGAWNGTFTVTESPDGVSWTPLRTISGSGAIPLTTTGITFSDNPLSTTRFIRWTYATQTNGNIALCNIDILTPAAPLVTPATLTGLLTGTPYSYNIIASNSPTSYAITGGSLPTGLSLNTVTGAITGTPAVAGTYSITVTATNGTGTSPAATISFTVTASATNDLCGNVIPLTVNASATTANMTGATVTAPFTLDNDVWYSFTASCNGTHNISLTGFTGDMDIELFMGPGCPASTTFLDNSAGVTATETISNTLTSGATYYVRVLSYNNTADTSNYTIQVTTSGTININNTGSPAASFINANTSNVVIMGFTTTPNCATSYSLTSVTITKSGTATTSDISNLRIFYDANSNGIVDGGESSVSGAGLSLANSMVFTLAGQTGLTTTRNYLLVCDVALAAVIGNTITASISLSTNLVATIIPTGPLTGTAVGNTQTISPPACTSAVISSITPASGPEGTEVTINASSGNLSGGIVRFNGVLATVVSSSASTIVAIVPSGATSGTVTITDSQPCNANVPFTVISKDITSCQGGNIATDLFLSEVTDSNTGALSYVEIYNGTGATINLAPYSIRTASNGGLTFSNTVNLSNVNLLNGSTYVVALGVTTASACPTSTTPGADGSYSNQASGGGSVNLESGKNDFIGLYKSGTLIDSWGVFGNANWASALIPTIGNAGFNFSRLNTASPLPNPAYTGSDWNIIDYAGSACANNNYSNIGTFTFLNAIPPSITTQPVFNANCQAGTISVSAVEGFAGGNSLAYQWYAVAPGVASWTALTNTGVYSGTTTSTLGISNLAGLSGCQYYCQVRENGATCYTASYAVKINDGSLIWNGVSWRDSNNVVGVPSITKTATINANYNTLINGSFDCCSLVVNNGATATIGANNFINVQNNVTMVGSGNLIVEDNGSLVQVSDTGVNTGQVTVNRIHTVRKFDYVYLSSPVSGFPLTSVSPTTSTAHLWKWIPTIGGFFGNWVNTTENMITGKGYIVRGPSGFSNTVAADHTASYRGVPNNGSVAVDVERGGYTGPDYPNPNPLITDPVTKYDDNWNLVGNPYPSAIDAKAFMTFNTNIEGVIRIWTHGNLPSAAVTNPFYGSFTYNYTGTDFILYNLTGPSVQNGYNGYIPSGQGFFVAMLDGPADATQKVYFNNAMRSKTFDNTQFFRHAQQPSQTSTSEKSRIWLDLVGPNQTVSRTMLGYVAGATNEKDRLYDASYKFVSNQNFYTLLHDEALNIQGRSVPFDKTDKVHLGYKVNANETYQIAIASLDGLFLQSDQQIYLEDKWMHVVHDLKQSPYTFTSAAGRTDDRFILRYTNEFLSRDDFQGDNESVAVASNTNEITVRSEKEEITAIQIYDILGREIFKIKNVNAPSFLIRDLRASQQTLLIKVMLQNGLTVTKKLVY